MPSSRAARLISEVGRRVQNHLANLVAQVEQLVNGAAAAEAGAAAFEASGAFNQLVLLPFLGIESALDKRRIRVLHGLFAMVADDAHQALGEDAVQRGDKVVGLDAHVQEAAEHVEHVVGVDGGEDQVAGERGVDGDLRGLLVADFADHDLVGIVAQDGAETAGEGESFFVVDRDLGDAFELVLDRILDGDDLVFVVLDFAESGV